jgi:carbon monoxide dehydrogenase subunit G
MWKIVVLILAVIIAAFVIVVAMRPGNFKIARSITIKAQPSDAFALVNDFHKMDAWSPFMKMDPNVKKEYTGAPSGVGAGYAWMGSGKTGQGKMMIVDSRPNELVEMNLEMVRPMKAVNSVEFTFKPEGDQTKVTWVMSGRNSFVSKAFSLFFNMDKMVGAEFEKGLLDMKVMAEQSHK